MFTFLQSVPPTAPPAPPTTLQAEALPFPPMTIPLSDLPALPPILLPSPSVPPTAPSSGRGPVQPTVPNRFTETVDRISEETVKTGARIALIVLGCIILAVIIILLWNSLRKRKCIGWVKPWETLVVIRGDAVKPRKSINAVDYYGRPIVYGWKKQILKLRLRNPVHVFCFVVLPLIVGLILSLLAPGGRQWAGVGLCVAVFVVVYPWLYRHSSLVRRTYVKFHVLTWCLPISRQEQPIVIDNLTISIANTELSCSLSMMAWVYDPPTFFERIKRRGLSAEDADKRPQEPTDEMFEAVVRARGQAGLQLGVSDSPIGLHVLKSGSQVVLNWLTPFVARTISEYGIAFEGLALTSPNLPDAIARDAASTVRAEFALEGEQVYFEQFYAPNGPWARCLAQARQDLGEAATQEMVAVHARFMWANRHASASGGPEVTINSAG